MHTGELKANRRNKKAGVQPPALSCAASALCYNRVHQRSPLLHRAGECAELFHNRLRMNGGGAFGKLPLRLLGFGIMDNHLNRTAAFHPSASLPAIHIKAYAPAALLYACAFRIRESGAEGSSALSLQVPGPPRPCCSCTILNQRK